ncbi:hypothetical protein SAMD00023353_8800170 [Rosellinia necatrix]|uniref:Uncharacterized protein n=1 Tax=Rosellinia necatrix TaxID=77044 RepID=A0A1W2TV99_ROSNE|nr:hypothetical protein SAMD00023353_8800170 [Rosellinia necatrix]
MIPTHFPFPGPVHHAPFAQMYASQHPPLNTTAPFKRPVGDEDDDIQFISEKPVKRRRVSEKQPTIPALQQNPIPFIDAAHINTSSIPSNIPTTAVQTSTSDLRDTERRLSTGMVGLPSDMNAIELTYALRGVSMPALENFVLDQPFRKPRLPSPPELSPKQLPSTISPPMFSVQSEQFTQATFGLVPPSSTPMVCPSSSHTSHQAEKPATTPDLTQMTVDTNKSCHPEMPINLNSRVMPVPSDHEKAMMAMPTSNLHQFGQNFAPVIMPISDSPYVPLPSQPQPQPPPSPQVAAQQSKEAEKDKEPTPEQPKKKKARQESQPKNVTANSSSASTNPIKPPASLIQPTYRKPSPNLVVDVAETCQEKFPFEEVAKRHHVPVDKVFDIFAAIIQVPLLRCPTDRRRQGRLATARIKQYNKAKKDIQDSRAANAGGGKPEEDTVNAADVAQTLGQVGFPEGFTLGGKS